MKARVLCPHCKVQGRLIRLTETSGDKLKCRHCGHIYTRDEIAIIYENAARAFAEAAAKVRKQPMKEPHATPAHKYPSPIPTTCATGTSRTGCCSQCWSPPCSAAVISLSVCAPLSSR